MVRDTHMWQPKVNLGWHSSGAIYLGFFEAGSPIGLEFVH